MNIRFVLSCARVLGVGMAVAMAGASQAQVVEAGYPTSILATQNADVANWAGWSPGNFFYGGGNAAHGSSGTVTHTYNSLSHLQAIRIGIDELRNQSGPFVLTNTPHQTNWGRVVFTPQVNLPYQITGRVTMVLSGLAGSSSSVVGLASLEVVGGPTLATYGGSMFRNDTSSIIGDVFDASAPLTGASAGMLQAGVTYRFNWSYAVGSEINLTDGLLANIFSLDGPSFMQIAFVPAPGNAAILALAGIAGVRRRRSS